MYFTLGKIMDYIKTKFKNNSSFQHKLTVKPRFIDFHHIKVIKDYEYPIHRHNSYELIYVVDGLYRCRINERELYVEPGFCFFIKPGDWHADSFRKGQFHYVLHFELLSYFNTNTSLSIFNNLELPEERVTSCNSDEMKIFFENLENESTVQDSYSSLILDSVLESFMWKEVRKLSPKILSKYFIKFNEQYSFNEELLKVFEQNFAKNIDIAFIASKMNVSRRTLSTRCQEFLGKSPIEAYGNFRINKACEMLETSKKTIQEISDYLGFSSQFNFSRTFKKFVGCPPSAYSSKT